MNGRARSPGCLLTLVYLCVQWRVLFLEVIHSGSALCVNICCGYWGCQGKWWDREGGSLAADMGWECDLAEGVTREEGMRYGR